MGHEEYKGLISRKYWVLHILTDVQNLSNVQFRSCHAATSSYFMSGAGSPS
jgi:hypothetical protein